MHTFPDVHSASEEYAARFGGAIGDWLLEVQTSLVERYARASGADTVLDVGGGHGQIARPLASKGLRVTVVASEPGAVDAIAREIDRGTIACTYAPLTSLPFEDRSFPLVTSVRIVSHLESWGMFIDELCRVSSNAVVVDYPSLSSVNVASSSLFKAKRRIEKNTRTFTVFEDREIAERFTRNGYTVERIDRQFLFPMALHRGMRSPRVSRALERLATACHLTERWGSPVMVYAVRRR
jgi:ubiquinone/menaquinone biosynthesis C-methylase UbiE